MPLLKDLIVKYRVILVNPKADLDVPGTVLSATAEVGSVAVWQWRKGNGPLRLDTGTLAASMKDAHIDNLVQALTSLNEQTDNTVLLVRAADQMKVTAGVKSELKKLFESQSQVMKWIILEGDPGKLAAYISDLDLDPAKITAELLPPAPTAGVKNRQSVELEDIGDPDRFDRFDRDDWSQHLNHLNFQELWKIHEREDLVKESIARVKKLCTRLKEIVTGKSELIDLMAWSTVAHLPMLLLGPWGTGKSMLVRQFSKGLGINRKDRNIFEEDELLRELASKVDVSKKEESARYFEYLVTRFTTPEELLGTVDVNLMLSHSVYLRRTAALLPRAEIAFLDEVFKANSAILNALLSLVNERLFYNAGVPWTVNLVMMFAASNEPPQEADLGAFYDRFPIRAVCDPVGNDDLKDLVERSHAQQFLSLIPDQTTLEEWNKIDARQFDPKGTQKAKLASRRMTQVASVNDFRLLRKLCLLRFGGADLHGDGKNEAFLTKFFLILRNLRREYDISDRSCGHFFRLARARALLDGRQHLIPEDCMVLGYCGKTMEDARRLPGIVAAYIH